MVSVKNLTIICALSSAALRIASYLFLRWVKPFFLSQAALELC